MWDLIVSVPDHCLPFYSTGQHANLKASPRIGPRSVLPRVPAGA